MLDIIRTCDELKRARLLHRVGLRRTGPAHGRARAGTRGGRRLGPAPPPVRAARGSSTLSARGTTAGPSTNPFDAQSPWVRIRGTEPASRRPVRKANRVLADSSGGVPFQPDGTASPSWCNRVEPSARETPDGGRAFCYRAENRGKAAFGLVPADARRCPRPLDLTRHRRLGVWLRAEGQGGILNVQLAGKDCPPRSLHHARPPGWQYHDPRSAGGQPLLRLPLAIQLHRSDVHLLDHLQQSEATSTSTTMACRPARRPPAGSAASRPSKSDRCRWSSPALGPEGRR